MLRFLIITFLVSGCANKAFSDCAPKTLELSSNKVKISQRFSTEAKGLILIMPPTGGSNFLDRQYAISLCEGGFDTFILESWEGQGATSLDLNIHKKLLTRGQSAIDSVLAQSDYPFIGMLGTSVGALHGATAFGRRPDIKAAFLIAGGGPINQVIAESDQSTLKNYRDKRMKKFGFKNLQDYSEALKKAIPEELDALTYKKAIENKPLFLVLGAQDTTVLTQHQENWVEELDPDQVERMNSGHIWTIIKAWWFLENKVLNFFNQATLTLE